MNSLWQSSRTPQRTTMVYLLQRDPALIGQLLEAIEVALGQRPGPQLSECYQLLSLYMSKRDQDEWDLLELPG